MQKQKRHMNECNRCQYEWFGKEDAVKCPNCDSPYWNQARVRTLINMEPAEYYYVGL